MAEMIQRKRRAPDAGYLLIDSFEGALSDFADETIANVYPTEEEAIAETMERVMVLANYHKGLFTTGQGNS